MAAKPMSVLHQAGVRTMCLPAAHETVHTWIHGFGLQPMLDDDLEAACKDLRLLIFPGTQVLQKQLLPPLPPKEGPLMIPPWDEEPAAPPTDAQTAADISGSELQQAMDGVVVTAQLPASEARAAASAAATAVALPIEMPLPAETATQQAEAVATASGMMTEPSKAWPDPVAAAVDQAGDKVMAEVAQAHAQNIAAVPRGNGQALLDAATAVPSHTQACSEAIDAASEPHSVSYEAASQEQEFTGQPDSQMPASLDTNLYSEAGAAFQDAAVLDNADAAGTMDMLQQASCSQVSCTNNGLLFEAH